MKKRLIPLIVCLVFLVGGREGDVPGTDEIFVYNVADAGAVPDAELATCDKTYNPWYCTAFGSGSDNSDAFAYAYQVAGASGGQGKIIVPPGRYRAEILHNVDNVTLECMPGAVIYPNYDDTDGGEILKICADSGCTSASPVVDPKIKGCCFADDWPERSVNYSIITGTLSGTPGGGLAAPFFESGGTGYVEMTTDAAHTLAVGDFIRIEGDGPYTGRHEILEVDDADTVTFAGTYTTDDEDDTWLQVPGDNDLVKYWTGAHTTIGRVLRWDHDHSILRLNVTATLPVNGTDIYQSNDTGWTLENIQDTCQTCKRETGTEVEMQGIKVDRGVRPVFEDVCISDVAGVGILLDSGSAANPTFEASLRNVTTTNVPAVPSVEGQAIKILNAEATAIDHWNAEGGVDPASGNAFRHGILDIGALANGLKLTNSRLVDEGTLWDNILTGIRLNPNSAAIDKIEIAQTTLRVNDSAVIVDSQTFDILSTIFSNTTVETGVFNYWTKDTGSDLLVRGGSLNCGFSSEYAFTIKGRDTRIEQFNVYDCKGGLLLVSSTNGAPARRVELVHLNAYNIGAENATSNIFLSQALGISKRFLMHQVYIEFAANSSVSNAVNCNTVPNTKFDSVTLVEPQGVGFLDCKIHNGVEVRNPEGRAIDTSISGAQIVGGTFIDTVGGPDELIALDSANNVTITGNYFQGDNDDAVEELGTSNYNTVVGNVSVSAAGGAGGPNFSVHTGGGATAPCDDTGTGANSVCAANIDR